MSDKRNHRGPNSKDLIYFSTSNFKILKMAVDDYCYLLTRDYPPKSALQLVGNRYGLHLRQREAVARISCSEDSLRKRKSKEIDIRNLDFSKESYGLGVDGFNIIVTIEAALGGGIILEGRDGFFRDLASVHKHYRKVKETEQALQLIGKVLSLYWKGETINWFLDAPVSNSGRLKLMISKMMDDFYLPGDVQLVRDPDKILIQYAGIVASADSRILDDSLCHGYINLSRMIIENEINNYWHFKV